MRLRTISTASLVLVMIFTGCSVFKVNFVDKNDIVGEWLLTGIANDDKVYQYHHQRNILVLYKNDSCNLTLRDEIYYSGTYKLDGNSLTINLKPRNRVERYQITSLREGKMEVAASEHSMFLGYTGGYISWQKLDKTDIHAISNQQ